MRDAVNIKDITIIVDSKKGKIISLWVTEDNTVYAKVKFNDGNTINHKLTKISKSFDIKRKKRDEDN